MALYIAVICVLAIIFLYILHYLLHHSRKGELIDKIPGPYAWPIIGNIFSMLVPLEEIWAAARKLNFDYYPMNRIWSVHVPVVNIYHPDDVEVLLSSTKHIEKSVLYEFIHPWLGTGLLTSKGAKWHERRRILTPAFHFKVLQQFVGTFMEQSEKLAESLCLEGEEVIPDVLTLLHKFTLNSICESAMGLTCGLDADTLEEYRKNVTEMNDIIATRIFRPWLHLDWMFQMFKKFKDQVRVLKVLHGFSTKIINERKQYHEETGGQHLKELGSSIYGFDEELIEGKRRLAMLDLMILAQKQGADIDDNGIREEVDTFVFEGHDTTATALCYTLQLIAENKEVQDKARAEVDAVFGGKETKKLSLRELQGLTYLERCIKESLRLFPSVPFISRNVTEDIQLKNHLVPAGTIINTFILDLHRDPNFWPNPDVFDPDRFLPDRVQGRHPFAYVPFSAGPRNCIGQKFAILEMKALVGTFLNNFYLENINPTSDIGFYPDLVLRPLKPIGIKLIRRIHEK